MRVLLVGAGAVGTTYGFHLARGGAQVSFLVKPRHAEPLGAGVVVHRLNQRGAPERFDDFEVLTDVDEAARRPWDQVWLCVSSTALRTGDWLDRLLAGIDAALVTLQPGLEDRAHLEARYPAERIVSGMISLVAYQTPLPGGSRRAGVAWWFPPLAPSPFSGDQTVVAAIVGALRAGGCPAKPARDVAAQVAFGAALMMPIIAGLEVAGWSFAELPRSAAWGICRQAARETTAVARPGLRRGLVRLLTASATLRAGLWITARVMPLDLEAYLKYHFVKVGDQTRAALHLYARRARESGLPCEGLESLVDHLS